MLSRLPSGRPHPYPGLPLEGGYPILVLYPCRSVHQGVVTTISSRRRSRSSDGTRKTDDKNGTGSRIHGCSSGVVIHVAINNPHPESLLWSTLTVLDFVPLMFPSQREPGGLGAVEDGSFRTFLRGLFRRHLTAGLSIPPRLRLNPYPPWDALPGFGENPSRFPLTPRTFRSGGTSPAGLSRGLGTHHQRCLQVARTISGGLPVAPARAILFASSTIFSIWSPSTSPVGEDAVFPRTIVPFREVQSGRGLHIPPPPLWRWVAIRVRP